MSDPSSSETSAKSSRSAAYCPLIFTRSGNSSRQGAHQVAQKLTRRGRACASPAPSSDLSSASLISVIFGRGTASSPEGFAAAVFDDDCLCAVAPPAPPVTAQASEAASAPTTKSILLIFAKTLQRLAALDGAAEGFCLRTLDGLPGEHRLDCVAQLRRGDRVARARVVNAPVVDELAGGVEQVRFGRDLCVEAVGDDVPVVLEYGEGQALVRRVLLDLPDGLGRVGVDADYLDAARRGVWGELLHSRGEADRDRAAPGDEDARAARRPLE